MQTRLLAIFAALFTAIALIAGCSSKSEESSKPPPDPASLLKESSETTKSQSSMHLKLAVQGEIKELPIESLEGDLTNKPAVAAQGTANIVFLGQRLEGVDFSVVDGTLYPQSLTFASPQACACEQRVLVAASLSSDSVYVYSRRGERTSTQVRPSGGAAGRRSGLILSDND